MKRIQLYISVWKEAASQISALLQPVSAGAALYAANDPRLPLCDDRGDNISALNPQYCELTVQYWAWKNQSFDFGGLLHQRRYFDFSSLAPYACDQPKRPKRPYRILQFPTQKVLDTIGLTETSVSQLLQRYRIIAPLPEDICQSVEDYYNRRDKQAFDDLGLLRTVISDLYPSYTQSAEQYLQQTNAYFCNMFVADRALFEQYSKWLFTILEEYTRRKPSDKQYPREQGKLAERLFGIYMTYLKTQTSVPWAELPRVHFSAINGATPKNMSFSRFWYHICPPNSRRRGWLRKLKK